MAYYFIYRCVHCVNRGTGKVDHLKDVKINLSHDLSKKVSFCPNIHVVQLPGESQSTDGSRGLSQIDIGAAALEDSVELCRGSSKSDSFDSILYSDQVDIPEKPSRVPLPHISELSSSSGLQLDVQSKSAPAAAQPAETDRHSAESGISLLMSCESAEVATIKSPGGKANQLQNSYVEKFNEFLGLSGGGTYWGCGVIF
jgi:hypothetical protein